MSQPGSSNYRVGLIIADSQPFHNGMIKIIGDAMMSCDDLIISFTNYNTKFFNYEFNQKMGRKLYGENKNISYFGTPYNPLVITPKQILENTLLKLEEAHYNNPTHFFTHLDNWVTPAMELQLETQHISSLIHHKSRDIIQSIENYTDDWKSKVPHTIIEDIETYVATKNRTF